MPYFQNGCHSNYVGSLGYLGDKSNTWRENGPWIYANYHDPYILTVNFGLPNHWICCNGYLDCSG